MTSTDEPVTNEVDQAERVRQARLRVQRIHAEATRVITPEFSGRVTAGATRGIFAARLRIRTRELVAAARRLQSSAATQQELLRAVEADVRGVDRKAVDEQVHDPLTDPSESQEEVQGTHG